MENEVNLFSEQDKKFLHDEVTRLLESLGKKQATAITACARKKVEKNIKLRDDVKLGDVRDKMCNMACIRDSVTRDQFEQTIKDALNRRPFKKIEWIGGVFYLGEMLRWLGVTPRHITKTANLIFEKRDYSPFNSSSLSNKKSVRAKYRDIFNEALNSTIQNNL